MHMLPEIAETAATQEDRQSSSKTTSAVHQEFSEMEDQLLFAEEIRLRKAQEEAAVKKIQKLHRTRSAKSVAKQLEHEEQEKLQAAATRIQSIQRARLARRGTEK